MATLTLTITYPDAQATRIMTALKTYWTVNGVVPTNADVAEKLRLVAVANMKDIVLRVEREAAVKAAADAITGVDAT